MINHSMPTIGKKEIRAVSNVLRSGQIAQGTRVDRFERKFSQFIGSPYAAGVSSGTSSLSLAVRSLGLNHADQVIIPSFCCAAVYQAVKQAGATPVICDISLDDYNLSVYAVKQILHRRTKCIILPHMFGCPAPIQDFISLKIPVIEDCAQSVGAGLYHRKAGSFGRLSVFSFYATKMMTCGEGGMVVSKDKAIIHKVKNMRSCDKKKDLSVRFNHKMTDFQAALGIVQLERLTQFIKRRQQIAHMYCQAFSKIHAIVMPGTYPDREHVFFRYVIRSSKSADHVVARFRNNGVQACKPVPLSLHRMAGLPAKRFPQTEEAFRHAVSIPIYPMLTNAEVKKIIAVTKGIVGN